MSRAVFSPENGIQNLTRTQAYVKIYSLYIFSVYFRTEVEKGGYHEAFMDTTVYKSRRGGYKQNNTSRIGSAMLIALAAVFIILLLTACPNAAGGGTEGGTGSGTGEGSTGGNPVVYQVQQALCDNLMQQIWNKFNEMNAVIPAEGIKNVLIEMNKNIKQFGFQIVDKKAGTPIQQGTSQTDFKARFIIKQDAGVINPYAAIVSDPADLVLVITNFDSAAKTGSFVVAGTVSGIQVIDGGAMKINAAGTEATISEASTPALNGTHPIADQKVTVMEHTFNISALLK